MRFDKEQQRAAFEQFMGTEFHDDFYNPMEGCITMWDVWQAATEQVSQPQEQINTAYSHIDWVLQMHMPNLPANKDRDYIETRLRLALEALNPEAYAQLVADENAI